MLTSKNLVTKLNNTKEIKHRRKLVKQILDMQSAHHKSKGNVYEYNKVYIPTLVNGLYTVKIVQGMMYNGNLILKKDNYYDVYDSTFKIIGSHNKLSGAKSLI